MDPKHWTIMIEFFIKILSVRELKLDLSKFERKDRLFLVRVDPTIPRVPTRRREDPTRDSLEPILEYRSLTL